MADAEPNGAVSGSSRDVVRFAAGFDARAVMHWRTIALPRFTRRMMPGSGLRGGPPRRESWIEDYSETDLVPFRVAYSPEQENPLSAVSQHGTPIPFEPVAREAPTVGVLAIPNGTIAGNNGYVLDRNGVYLIDTNLWYPDYRQTPAFGYLKRVSTSRLAGVTLSLLTLWADHNYFHFLIESLPRIAVFQAAKGSWGDVDHVLLPAHQSRSSAEARRLLGIPENKIRSVRFGEYVSCDTLLATSFPGRPRQPPRWAADFLRGLGPAGSQSRSVSATDRLYIRRGPGRRRLENETEIENLLTSRFGFRVFDFQNERSEVDALSQASVIVGPHGAGLSRMVFSPPGALVVELLNPQWLMPFYRCLAESSQHMYVPVVGTTVNPTRWRRTNPDGAYSVSLADLTTVLERSLPS